MKMKFKLVLVASILLSCFLVFSQAFSQEQENTETYLETTYDYPSPNVVCKDLKINKYYGGGRFIRIDDDEILKPIIEDDALSRYLTILHSGGGESSMLADSYTGSVAQFSTLVNEVRNEVGKENTLLLSVGDNIKKCPQYQVSKGALEAKAMNLMQYDASAVGNYDFDMGTEGLKKFFQKSEFPMISSNMFISVRSPLVHQKDKDIFNVTVVERAGRNIGIVGATGGFLSLESSRDYAVEILEVRERLQDSVNYLMAKGMNVIIAIIHLQDFEAEKKLASEIEGVDVFVAGGGNALLGNSRNSYIQRADDSSKSKRLVYDSPQGEYPYQTESLIYKDPVLLVSTAGSYDYLGRLTVLFDEKGVLSMVDYGLSGPIPVTKDIEPDPVIQSTIVDRVKQKLED